MGGLHAAVAVIALSATAAAALTCTTARAIAGQLDSQPSWRIRDHLGGYATWARSHNSLLIVTWDEDGTILGLGGDGNKVPAIFYGAHVHVRPGTYGERTGHYGILRTVEDMYGLPHAGASASAAPVTDVWK